MQTKLISIGITDDCINLQHLLRYNQHAINRTCSKCTNDNFSCIYACKTNTTINKSIHHPESFQLSNYVYLFNKQPNNFQSDHIILRSLQQCVTVVQLLTSFPTLGMVSPIYLSSDQPGQTFINFIDLFTEPSFVFIDFLIGSVFYFIDFCADLYNSFFCLYQVSYALLFLVS